MQALLPSANSSKFQSLRMSLRTAWHLVKRGLTGPWLLLLLLLDSTGTTLALTVMASSGGGCWGVFVDQHPTTVPHLCSCWELKE